LRLFQNNIYPDILRRSKSFNLNKLLELSFLFCEFFGEFITDLLGLLAAAPKIKVFRLTGNSNIKKDDIMKMIKQQFSVWNLEILELKNQKIDYIILSEILTNLNNSKLRCLNLDSNIELGDEAVLLLSKSQIFSKLRILSLGGPYHGCNLSWKGIKILLSSSHKIRHLDLSWNVQSDDIEYDLKEINPNIFSLDISYCCFSKLFVENLSKSKTLKRLINKKNEKIEKIYEDIKEKYQL
jgi:hypothetical protein